MGNIEHWKATHDKTIRLEEPLVDVLDGHEALGEFAESVYELRVAGYRLAEQLGGAVDAFADFIAAVAAPTGRLRLTENVEGEVLYAAVKEARATLNHLRGQ